MKTWSGFPCAHVYSINNLYVYGWMGGGGDVP